MASMTNFIRNTSLPALRAYFDQTGVAFASPINWDSPANDVVSPLLKAVTEMDEQAVARVMNDADRVTEMTDEAGQTAIYSISKTPDLLDQLPNAHDRALWVFIKDPTGFRHAEEVRFTDERRRGRMWDGFLGEPELKINLDEVSIAAFKAAIRDRFESKNVEVDVFDRTRPTFAGDDCGLVQVTVYREGRLDDVLEFVDGSLDRRSRRPVFEAALTYEPATGVIEVVGNDRESRKDLVGFLSRDLLKSDFRQEHMPLRQFDLSVLLQPFAFPTDAEDGIESVRVNLLRLMPIESVGERMTLECLRQAPQTIWNMADQRFGGANPLKGGWVVTQAKLTIRFHPKSGSRRGKVVPLTITMPHGCDLKDRTERERMIGEKYLLRWGIMKDV
jgi:hypothetical protein